MRYSTSMRAAILALSCLSGWQPADGAAILFYVDGVAAGQPTRVGDIPIRDRMLALGHTVTTVNDTDAATTDLVGKNLVVISSSIQSGDLAAFATSTLRTLPLPIVVYESALYDELLMGGGGTNPTGLSTLNITLSSHPLAAGLTGTAIVYSSANVMSVGVTGTLGTDATIVATAPTGEPAIFTYGAGSRLSDNATIIAARRVGLYLNETGVPSANADGLRLFDTAVGYALAPEPGSIWLFAGAALTLATLRRSHSIRG
jgi:hypothetical protein